MAENYTEAEKDYIAGMKYKDIAIKHNVSINTVKSWKQRYKWTKDKKRVHTKPEKGCTQNKKGAQVLEKQIEDGTRETLQNNNLTPEQQMFCIYYSRTFNATQSYLNAYGCSYEVANAKGSCLTVKDSVKAEIERLKEIKRQQIVAQESDIVELQMRIAFSDLGNYLTFGRMKIESKSGKMVEINTIDLKETTEVDTQLIKKIKEGRDGVSIEMEDRQSAIDWLSKYFLVHPDDRYKAEFNRKRAEVKDNMGEEILKNMQTIAEILQHPAENRSISDLEQEEKKNEHTGTAQPEAV